MVGVHAVPKLMQPRCDFYLLGDTMGLYGNNNLSSTELINHAFWYQCSTCENFSPQQNTVWCPKIKLLFVLLVLSVLHNSVISLSYFWFSNNYLDCIRHFKIHNTEFYSFVFQKKVQKIKRWSFINPWQNWFGFLTPTKSAWTLIQLK